MQATHREIAMNGPLQALFRIVFAFGARECSDWGMTMPHSPAVPPLPTPDLLDRLQQLDHELAAAAPFKPKSYRRTGKLDLLFVDDQRFVRQTVTALLTDRNLNLHFADNAADAVKAYIACPPHLVFLDIDMPDVSGFDLLKIISRNDAQAHPIMLTGTTTVEHVKFAKELGAKGYVAKPFSRDKLIGAVERYLNGMGG